MIAASRPSRPHRLFVVGEQQRSLDASAFAELFRAGDVLVINDASTLPASLHGTHVRSGAPIEVRLARCHAADPREPFGWDAIVFGAGDYRTPTELRALPPSVLPGDVLALGSLRARIESLKSHPRMVALHLLGEAAEVWEGLARHGRPIQYAHVPEALALWDVQTIIAGPPVALEPPSAGFLLDWAMLAELRARGVEIVSLTHAAGLSSTGDPTLDARFPLPEAYAIPASTALAVRRARARGARVIALGTTVARALESAARVGGARGLRAGRGVATLLLGPQHQLAIVDVLLTGVHERGTSHHELMRAFAEDGALETATRAMEAADYRHHEFGDAVWLEARRSAPLKIAVPQPRRATGK